MDEFNIRVQCGYFAMTKMITPPMNIRQSVANIRICPRERFLAVGTTHGVLYALSLVDPKKGGEKTEFSHDFHGGSTVSCLLWAPNGKRLFSACTTGVVAVTRLRMGVSAFFGSADTEMLLREETGIVQLDYMNDGQGQELLLVSSQTRVLILSLNADVATVVQIGTKLRQGIFGGCFFQGKVYSARPGKRIWVADPSDGQVLSTLKFASPKAPIEFIPKRNATSAPLSQKTHMFSLMKVFTFTINGHVPQFIIWTPNTKNLYLVDPVNVQIVEWHVDFGEIHYLAEDEDNKLFILHGEDRQISVVKACTEGIFMDAFHNASVLDKIQIALAYGITDMYTLECLRRQLGTQTNDDLDMWIAACEHSHVDDGADALALEEESVTEDMNDIDMNDRESTTCVEISTLDDDDPVFHPIEPVPLPPAPSPVMPPDSSYYASISGYLPTLSAASLLPTFEKPQAPSPRKPRIVSVRKELSVPILQTAMSVDFTGVGSAVEVLMEAISADIWDKKIKFESKLPIHEQFSLPPMEEIVEEQEEQKKRPSKEQFREAIKIFKYIRPYRFQFIVGMALLFIGSLIFMA